MKKKINENYEKKRLATITIARSYDNADIEKQQICTENNNKTGIYR